MTHGGLIRMINIVSTCMLHEAAYDACRQNWLHVAWFMCVFYIIYTITYDERIDHIVYSSVDIVKKLIYI